MFWELLPYSLSCSQRLRAINAKWKWSNRNHYYVDLYHVTCSRENWCCKKCSGCPTEHAFHSIPCTGLSNLLRFWDKAVFRLLFTNCNVALQIPHKLQSILSFNNMYHKVPALQMEHQVFSISIKVCNVGHARVP